MISIIIPIFNGEKTIARCIDSILASNNTEFEIIIVNDGSTDNTEKICLNYAAIDSRIAVISIPNGGVSNARNVGLKKAKGTWVAFIDADDYVDSDYLTIPSELAETDIIEKSYSIVRQENIEKVDIDNQSIVFADSNLNQYIAEYVNYKSRALWNKIFKRTVIAEVRFQTGVTMGEDFIFFLECYPAIRAYSYTPTGRYFYCDNEDSATTKNLKNLPKRIDGLLQNAETIRLLMAKNAEIPVFAYVLHKIYIPIISGYNCILSKQQREKFHNIKKSLLKTDCALIGNKKRLMFIIDYLKESIILKLREQ